MDQGTPAAVTWEDIEDDDARMAARFDALEARLGGLIETMDKNEALLRTYLERSAGVRG